MSVAVQNNVQQTTSFDEALGITVIPVSADSIDDSTVNSKNSKASEPTHYLSRPDKPAPGPKLSTVTEGNQETVEDVRAWAKEASFKLKSFNYKIPGDKGSPYKNRNSLGKGETSTMVKVPSKKSVQEPVEKIVEVKQEEVVVQVQQEVVVEVKEESMQQTEVVENKEEEEGSHEELAGERINLESEEQQQQQGEEEPQENGEEGEGDENEEGEEEKSTVGIAAKKRTQLDPIDSNTQPAYYMVNLNHVTPSLPPVPTTIESKKYHLKSVVPNAHKQSGGASVSSFLNYKTKFGSRDSLSTLSHSQDDNDSLSIQSEPIFVSPKKQKPTDRPVTPYAKLKDINKRKDYGDFIESELETYLSDEEFLKVFGKSRVSSFFSFSYI